MKRKGRKKVSQQHWFLSHWEWGFICPVGSYPSIVHQPNMVRHWCPLLHTPGSHSGKTFSTSCPSGQRLSTLGTTPEVSTPESPVSASTGQGFPFPCVTCSLCSSFLCIYCIYQNAASSLLPSHNLTEN